MAVLLSRNQTRRRSAACSAWVLLLKKNAEADRALTAWIIALSFGRSRALAGSLYPSWTTQGSPLVALQQACDCFHREQSANIEALHAAVQGHQYEP